MTLIDDFAPDACEPTMKSVRALAEAVKKNRGNIMQLDISSKIQQLKWISTNESAPDDVRKAAIAVLDTAAANSLEFVLRKIAAVAKRAAKRVPNQLARDGIQSTGTVKRPATLPHARNGGQRKLTGALKC